MPWSRPARGAWVEILILAEVVFYNLSRPARGAWVEIVVKVIIDV